jgi:hypothetical protein
MKGGIYTREKCPVCGSGFVDTGKGLYCPNHKNITANKFITKFGSVFKNFNSYDRASRFLTGLRFKTDENTIDERDYRRDNPLGFTNMSNKFLATIKPETAKISTIYRGSGTYAFKPFFRFSPN